MAIERLNRSGDAPRRAELDGASGTPAPPPRAAEASRTPVRAADSVEVASYAEMAERFRAHAERLERELEGRRKLVDAVRELMNAGQLETPEAARRAALGILRRGA